MVVVLALGLTFSATVPPFPKGEASLIAKLGFSRLRDFSSSFW
jgi:hypothetical protein